jgi:hypothetical protein
MMDSYYPFQYRFNRVVGEGCFLSERRYTFVTRTGKAYVVLVQRYDYGINVVKFYAKKDEKSKGQKKFQVLTHEGDALKIIGTCLAIMLAIREKEPFANFAFQGINSAHETIENTQRFRIYSYLFKNTFDPAEYTHVQDESKSAYMIVHHTCPMPEYLDKVSKMFNDYYDKLT